MTGDKSIDTMYSHHLGRIIDLTDYINELDSDDTTEIEYVQKTIDCIMAEIREMYECEFGISEDDLDIISIEHISDPT